jgi:hypothetical protein
MKKVRINLKRGVRTWSFVIYDSVESAFLLKDDPLESSETEDSYRKVVTLRAGDFMEVEWMGSEWVYDDGGPDAPLLKYRSTSEKYDNVRIGKLSPLKDSAKKLGYLEVYSGWVRGDQLPWIQRDDQKDIRITPIIGKIRSKLDFSELFSELDEELTAAEAEEAETSEDSGPIVLN